MADKRPFLELVLSKSGKMPPKGESSKMSSDSVDESGGAADDAEKAAAQDLIDAVRKGDADAVATALRASYQACAADDESPDEKYSDNQDS